MSSDFFDNPKLFRHLVEELPVGIYIVDRDGLIRFWNRGAEHLTGHLGQDVVGHLLEDAVQACDRRGNSLSGERCPVMMTIRQRKPQRCTAFYLHKNGHRTAVRICTRPILEYGDAIGGATVLFEEAFFYREESSGPPMYGWMPGRNHGSSFAPLDAGRDERMHGGHGGIAYRFRVVADTGAGAGGVSIETRSPVGCSLSSHRSADIAQQSGCGELSGLLGRERVSGGAALGKSGHGGHDS